MGKLILGIIFISLLTSCKKSNSTGVSSGSWTFESLSYNDAKGSPGMWGSAVISVTAKSSNSVYPYMVVSNTGTVAFTSGTYPVGVVNVGVTDTNGNAYLPMLNNTGTVTVNANNGSVSLSSAGIKMVNSSNTDTSVLTFNITQTY